MTERPGFWNRVLARVAGEVPSGTLEAYMRAGGDVYGLLLDAERRRTELVGQGADPWSIDPATRAYFLCTWNAFALQTLGDEFVEADYRANPSTVGFVPPVTAEQAQRFYDDVGQWLSRARRAEQDPSYELDVYVPAQLPRWVEVEPCPREHLDAMISAWRKLGEHAELAVGDCERAANDGHDAEVAKLRGDLASVKASAGYAEGLCRGAVDLALHERIETSIKEAIEGAYRVGQLAAMPQLIGKKAPGTSGGAKGRLPGPGEPGFDPWVLTSPQTRSDWQRDPEAWRAVETQWRLDPDPRRTLEIQAEIDAALGRGDIDYATDARGRSIGNYFCCPWSAIYVVKRPVSIGGRYLRVLEQFTFDVSAEEVLEGGGFRREILAGRFSPTNEVDYCNPLTGGHRD